MTLATHRRIREPSPDLARAAKFRGQLSALIDRSGRLIETIEAVCSRPGP